MKLNAKKIWSVTWKTLTAIILLMAVFLGSLALDAYFKSYAFENRKWCRKAVEYTMWNSQSFKIKNAHRYVRTIDALTGETLTPKLKAIYPGLGDDSLAVFVDKKDRHGYLDSRTGKIVLTAQYKCAWPFSEGVAAVVKDNQLGFIDRQGNWVIQPQFAFPEDYRSIAFHNGLCWAIKQGGHYGIIDKQGNWFMLPEYDNIKTRRHGYYLLEKDEDHVGLADSCGQIILPCDYQMIVVLEDGVILQKDGRKWMVSPDLKTVIHPYIIDEENTFSVATDVLDEYGNYYHRDYEPIGTYRVGSKYGLLDRHSGRPITLAIYDGIEYISPNLFRCALTGDYKAPSIFINADGKEVKP